MTLQLNPHRSLSHTTYRAPSIELPSANSELGVTARDIGQVIADYTQKVHNSLDDWYDLAQQLNDLLKAVKPLIPLLKSLWKIAHGKAQSSPDGSILVNGNGSVRLTGKAVAGLVIAGAVLGPEFSKHFTIQYADSEYTKGSFTFGDAQTLSDFIEDLESIHKNQGIPYSEMSNLSITLSPDDAVTDLSLTKTTLIDTIPQKVTTLKNAQTKDLMKVMAFSNAKKSNEKSLSSLLQLLHSISNTALSNVQ